MRIKNTQINTLNKESLAELMMDITNDVANAVAKTYGPYGANTLIQSTDTVYMTKDGWTVAQNLTYPNNGAKNALKKLIMDCMQSVLLKTGDGTSTVALLARAMYSRIYDTFINCEDTYNIKSLEKALTEVINKITVEITSCSKQVTDETIWEVIHRIALISTNWDEEMAQFIADIYQKTRNPIIKFENSGSDESYVEYIDGYEIKGQLLLKECFINDHENGKCTIQNPAILVFNHDITEEMFEILYLMANSIYQAHQRQLVVIAPDFRPQFVNTLRSVYMQQQRLGTSTSLPIAFKYYNNLQIDKDCIIDLCYLLGTEPVSEDNTEMSDMLNKLRDALKGKKYVDQMEKPDEEEKEMIYEHCAECMDETNAYLSELCGKCMEITLTDKYLMTTNMTNAKMDIINERKKDLEHEIEVKTKESAALSMITEGIRLKRIRLGKLKLNMGVIHVGGFGDAHLKQRRDALDDATRACEAAYTYGYAFGGNTTPLIASKKICDNLDATIQKIPKNEKSNIDTLKVQHILATIIHQSYREVIGVMWENKYGENIGTRKAIARTIDEVITRRTPFNIMTDDYDKRLISPVSGDIEILKGSMSLVMSMIGTNQFVFHDIRSIEDLERIAAIDESGDVQIEDQIKLAKGNI